jgi:hypothetical protein
MVMKRCLLLLAALVPLGTGACNKPTQDDCRKAIAHWQELLGTEATSRNADLEGDVRRCRGGSTKEAVTCAINARTLAELNACAFRGSKGKSTAEPSPSAPSPTAPSPTAPSPGAPPPPGAPAPAPSDPAPSTK